MIPFFSAGLADCSVGQRGDVAGGPESNKIPFALKEFLKTDYLFPDLFEVVSKATLFSLPYVDNFTFSSLNVTFPFYTTLIIMPTHCLSHKIIYNEGEAEASMLPYTPLRGLSVQ